MNLEKILIELKKRNFKPVYWLEGDEEFYIDQMISYAERQILSESEAGFNLSIFYGKDTSWTDLLNTCRKYPMFSDLQVVILKEKAVVLTTKKLYDNELPEWTGNLVKSKGYTITNKALFLLIDHIGNDLSRLNNEIDKLVMNLSARKNITDDDIETYVGVSKEFNVFELQQAIASKDLYKAIRIVQYFDANPKAAPIQLIFPSLYNFFSKVQMIYGVPSRDDKAIAAAIGVNAWFVKDYVQAAGRFSSVEIEKLLLLLHQYNLKGLGVNNAGHSDAMLLKEMVVKMIAA